MTYLEFFTLSSPAPDKVCNEDACLVAGKVAQGRFARGGVLDLMKPAVFAIADGVSRSPAAHQASRQLLKLLAATSADELIQKPRSTLLALQDRFTQWGRKRGFAGAATTLVGLCLSETGTLVFNVGNSRAYRFRQGVMRQCSHDHTQLQDMIDAGEITPEQARSAAQLYSGLSSCFVAEPALDEMSVHIDRLSPPGNDTWLLCSDGLTEGLSDDEIARLVDGGDFKTTARRLEKVARLAGSTDDLSLLLLRTIA
ncbi:MAG: PP2C family protein-serine/threonine phosphatase [Stenotrophobium sp.]